MIPYILTNTSFSAVIDNTQYSADESHPKWKEIVDAVRAKQFNLIPDLIDAPKQEAREYVQSASSDVEIDLLTGEVLFQGEPVNTLIGERILQMQTEGFDANPLINFLKRQQNNPSKKAVDELYEFIEYGKMPITPDGCFIAYKRVRTDYTSVHDGKTDNSVGKIVSMPRNQVDDRSENVCSTGLHFCSHEYLKTFSGERVVILKIDPEHVVSIPVDYNNTKGRACQYEVIGELSPEQVAEALENVGPIQSSVYGGYDDDDEYADDEYFDDDDFDCDRTNSLMDTSSDDAVADSTNHMKYETGYRAGYASGRRNEGKPPHINDEWSKGFDDGFKDGKGHKAKKVK